MPPLFVETRAARRQKQTRAGNCPGEASVSRRLGTRRSCYSARRKPLAGVTRYSTMRAARKTARIFPSRSNIGDNSLLGATGTLLQSTADGLAHLRADPLPFAAILLMTLEIGKDPVLGNTCPEALEQLLEALPFLKPNLQRPSTPFSLARVVPVERSTWSFGSSLAGARLLRQRGSAVRYSSLKGSQ